MNLSPNFSNFRCRFNLKQDNGSAPELSLEYERSRCQTAKSHVSMSHALPAKADLEAFESGGDGFCDGGCCIGYPIIGDRRYGAPGAYFMLSGPGRFSSAL